MGELVEGEKQIAEVTGRSVAQVRREVSMIPDPLPAWRPREGAKGRLWGLRSRLALWALRHPVHGEADGVPASGVLEVVVGGEAIASVVRVRPGRLWRLLPWTGPGGKLRDPLPVSVGEDGSLRAYRDALHDWLDRRDEHAGSGREPTPRRRWKSRLVTERKREMRERALLESAGARSEKNAARVPSEGQDGKFCPMAKGPEGRGKNRRAPEGET